MTIATYFMLAGLSVFALPREVTSLSSGPVFTKMILIPKGCITVRCVHEPYCMPMERSFCLSPFYIDRTEVTFLQYRQCVQAGACTELDPYFDRHRIRSPELPVTGVTWDQASAYCRWVGRRLPTRSEWERAAAGPRGNNFVWPGRAFLFIDRQPYARALQPCSTPVDVTEEGICDMGLNVSEWVQDWFPKLRWTSYRYRKHNPKGPCQGRSTCKGLLFRSIKGGSWTGSFWAQQIGLTDMGGPPRGRRDLGFRCAGDAVSATSE